MTQPVHPDLARALLEHALAVVRDSPQHELSRTSASTLSRLQRLGPQRITVLAEREVVSQPSMTGLVQRLEGLGYVSRSVDPDDGRASLVAITAAGARAVDVRRRDHEQVIADRLTRLDPDDVAALDAALPALRNLVETHLIEKTENHVLA